MPQTLLGLLGILLVSVLSLQQMRSGITTESSLRAAEVQALAAQVGMAHLEALDFLPFDEAVKGAYAKTPSALTPIVGGVFVRSGPDPAGDDLDDIHGTETTTSHVIRDGEAGLDLRSSVRVEYMSESDGTTASATPTRLKRATVTVRSLDVRADSVVLSQLYSCGSYCFW